MAKTLYIIAGPNGAGKTTAAFTLLPSLLECREFVNGDEIARGLSPFNPEGVTLKAGKLQLERIYDLLSRGQTFAIETTLATRTYSNLIHRAKDRGYHVELIFFYLPSPVDAIQRVALRVKSGGHNIPVDGIRRRYEAGLRNLFQIYIPIVDRWNLFNNTSIPSVLMANSETIGTGPGITLESLKAPYCINQNEDTVLLTTTINRAYRNMLERKARLGEMVHTDDGTGKMRTQRAIDMYHRVYGGLPDLY